MRLHEEVVKSDLDGDSLEVDDFRVLFLEICWNIRDSADFNVMFSLFLSIDNNNFTIFPFLMFFPIFLEFLFPLILIGDECGDDGRLLIPADFRRWGVQFIFPNFRISGRIHINLRKGSLFIFVGSSIWELFISLGHKFIFRQVELEIFGVISGWTIFSIELSLWFGISAVF